MSFTKYMFNPTLSKDGMVLRRLKTISVICSRCRGDNESPFAV